MRVTHHHISPDRDTLRIEEYGDYCVLDALDAADQEQTRVVVRDGHRRHVAQALAGDEYVVHRRNQSYIPEFETAQPDRPEPVDPSEVKVGDYVEVTQRLHSHCIVVTGDVFKLSGESRTPFFIRGYGAPDITQGDTTVRVLRREPEPDEAAVEALAEAVRQVRAYRNWGDDSDETLARKLIRLGAYVEVPSDG